MKLIKVIKDNRALTIVEIIVSVGALLCIGLAVTSLANNAGRIVARAARLNQAVDFSSFMLNELLSFNYDALDMANSNLPVQDLPAASDLKTNYSGSRSYAIAEEYWDGSPALPGAGDYKRLSVITSYNDGHLRNISYETIKREPIS